jgi:hypothetical protein
VIVVARGKLQSRRQERNNRLANYTSEKRLMSRTCK